MPYADEILLDASDLTVDLVAESGPVRVLDGVSLRVRRSEVVDVVGPSGSGKSTLLRTLARLMPVSSGSLVLDKTSAEKIEPQVWRSRVALMPQRSTLIDGSVRDNLLLPWRFKVRSGERSPSSDEIREALDVLGLAEVSLERDAARLSVGQQARLAFARVWLTAPQVLLLDEAEASLDEASVQALFSAVERFLVRSEDAGAGRAVVRVRHSASDGLAATRLKLEGGSLGEVAP